MKSDDVTLDEFLVLATKPCNIILTWQTRYSIGNKETKCRLQIKMYAKRKFRKG